MIIRSKVMGKVVFQGFSGPKAKKSEHKNGEISRNIKCKMKVLA